MDTALSRGGYVTAVDGSKAAILGKLSKDPGGAFKRSSAAEALGIVYLQAAELFFVDGEHHPLSAPFLLSLDPARWFYAGGDTTSPN